MDLQLPMLPVHITTDVVSSNHGQGEVYNIMGQVDVFLRYPPSIKLTATI
jgi:hypothetical protein